jgi:hypothetical protein
MSVRTVVIGLHRVSVFPSRPKPETATESSTAARKKCMDAASAAATSLRQVIALDLVKALPTER